MRLKLIPPSAACLLFVSCSGETVAQPPPAPVDWHSLQVQTRPDAGTGATAQERELAELYVAGLASPGFAMLAGHLDDDARLTFPGTDDAHGPEAIVRAHERLLGAFERTVSAGRVWRTSTEQAVEWKVIGTQVRDWMGIKAAEKRVTIKGLTLLWTKDDGSVTDLHIYFDVAAVKAQLGVGPKELLAQAAQARAAASEAPPPGPAQVFEGASSSAAQNNVDTARAALDALENGNLAAYEGTMTDDVEIHTLARAQPWRGKADASAYFKAMRKAIAQLDTTVSDSWSVGAFAGIEYTITGEQLGSLGWIPPQRDGTIRLHVVDIFEFSGGKIARVWRYDNPGEVISAPL